MFEFLLKYGKSAKKWEEALPLGNGRLGACVFGRTEAEIIRLNEKTLWEGYEYDWSNPETLPHLDEIRKLFFEKKYVEATELTLKYFKCIGNGEGEKYDGKPYGTFRNVGDIVLCDKDKNSLKERSLDILHGVAVTETNNYTSTHIVSLVEDVGITQIKAKNGKKLNIDVRFDKDGGGRNNDSSATGIRVSDFFGFDVTKDITKPFEDVSINENVIEYDCKLPGEKSMSYAFRLTVITDGVMKNLKDGISVSGADGIKLIYAARTTFDTADPKEETSRLIKNASDNECLVYESKCAFEKLMSRSTLDLKGDEALRDLYTDERLKRIKEGKTDNGFAELYFNYGKYLLISSSSRGSKLPANLQGIWSRDNTPPWSADYHTNINLQMNYWHANILNLSECEEPLLEYILLMQKYGSSVADKMFACSGWVAFHTTTPLGYTAPGRNPSWGSFACGGAWCVLHIFEHYRYTLDASLLKKYWNAAKESARFFLDYLVENEKGELVICPTNSPENSFVNPEDGTPVGMSAGCAMDSEILHDLFSGILELKDVAEEDDAEFLGKVQTALSKLPELKIGKNGTVMEWLEDYGEVWPGHRHMSHLFALFPSDQINESTPELFEAAKKTIERRLSNGGGHTGWSKAWVINFYARLNDGENAYKHLIELFEVGTLDNLFDKHPPFQIDGNFGGCAGIANMLLNSDNGVIKLLPALPKEWKNGSFTGFKAKGNKTVSCTWENGTVKEYKIQ